MYFLELNYCDYLIWQRALDCAKSKPVVLITLE